MTEEHEEIPQERKKPEPGKPHGGKKVPSRQDKYVKTNVIGSKFHSESQRNRMEGICKYRIENGYSTTVAEVVRHMMEYCATDACYYGHFKDYKAKDK